MYCAKIRDDDGSDDRTEREIAVFTADTLVFE